jgi:hypothetical protein
VLSEADFLLSDACLVRMAKLCDDGRAFAVDSDFRV